MPMTSVPEVSVAYRLRFYIFLKDAVAHLPEGHEELSCGKNTRWNWKLPGLLELPFLSCRRTSVAGLKRMVGTSGRLN